MTAMAVPSLTPLYIVGTAHCADLNQQRPWDPQSLNDARAVIADQVNIWLGVSDVDDIDAAGGDDDDEFISKDAAIALIVIIVILFVTLVAGAAGWWYMMKKSSSEKSGLNAGLTSSA